MRDARDGRNGGQQELWGGRVEEREERATGSDASAGSIIVSYIRPPSGNPSKRSSPRKSNVERTLSSPHRALSRARARSFWFIRPVIYGRFLSPKSLPGWLNAAGSREELLLRPSRYPPAIRAAATTRRFWFSDRDGRPAFDRSELEFLNGKNTEKTKIKQIPFSELDRQCGRFGAGDRLTRKHIGRRRGEEN